MGCRTATATGGKNENKKPDPPFSCTNRRWATQNIVREGGDPPSFSLGLSAGHPPNYKDMIEFNPETHWAGFLLN